ncbi:hypothetical protein CAPTEDRAFT_204379 [Capitella teleta]|uniref:Uncharacterized protein n=1 Tax=Capitella teleta TaxID=283909 RepID=R7TWA8_CAPTE|nr:hypothetical protein CAPTEDRAFT_204379 [Capitella teleta]|eukprot:ELT97857.1 hypothetical protein CAPTEDRAFT_204379 [Capitella teleta]
MAGSKFDPKSMCRTDNEQIAEMKNRTEQIRYDMQLTQLKREEKIEDKAMSKAVRQMQAKADKIQKKRNELQQRSTMRKSRSAPMDTYQRSVFVTEMYADDFVQGKHKTFPDIASSAAVVNTIKRQVLPRWHTTSSTMWKRRDPSADKGWDPRRRQQVQGFLQRQKTFNSLNPIPQHIKEETDKIRKPSANKPRKAYEYGEYRQFKNP